MAVIVRLVLAVALVAACAPAVTSTPQPTQRPRPSPTAVGTPGTGGHCSDPVPSGFTCATGTTADPSGALVAGVCVNVGPVANCPFYTDDQGRWRAELPNGVEFQLSFWSGGKERQKIDLTPSFLSGGTKEWPTVIVIDSAS